jgi:hypothetical protein
VATRPPDPPSWFLVRFGADVLKGVDLDYGFDSLEQAARGDIPEQFVKVVDVRIEGDYALVSMLTNDRPPHEPEEQGLVRIGSRWYPI